MQLEFTNDQRLRIIFNRPTVLPWFVNQTDDKTNGRNMIELQDINVVRDLFDISIDLHEQTA